MFHDLLQFQLFLFDFDGLLVNTELMHLEAYKKASHAFNFSMNWTYDQFCNSAHYSATGMREKLTLEFSGFKEDLLWKDFYQKKTESYMSFLQDGKVELMPGVERLLNQLLLAQKKTCVVTHSQKQMTDAIIKHIPLLQKIPNWITREDYQEAKPSPQGYLKAIEKLGAPGDKIIGFEDSPRGLQSLLGANVQAVWVTEVNYPEMDSFQKQGVIHIPSFNSL